MDASPEQPPGGAPELVVYQLGAVDVLTFTEISPNDSKLFAGKQVMRGGRIKSHPQATWWKWTTVQIPATVVALHEYLKDVQHRNAYLIRGVAREGLTSPARRLKENFLGEPTRLHFFDIDGHPGEWMTDPKAAVHQIVTQFGEPWASASYVWFFSGTHGMKFYDVGTGKYDKHGIEETGKYWRGEIVDGKIKVRLAFILDRAVGEREAVALTR
jgi:hypothetical protein